MDLLETYDMEVIYEFDKTYEGLPDEYWTKSSELGLQLVFDEEQKLTTIHLMLEQDEDFSPADIAESDIQNFGSKSEVREFGTKNNVPIVEGKSELFGKEKDWIRLDDEMHSVHYEYTAGELQMITISTPHA